MYNKDNFYFICPCKTLDLRMVYFGYNNSYTYKHMKCGAWISINNNQIFPKEMIIALTHAMYNEW